MLALQKVKRTWGKNFATPKKLSAKSIEMCSRLWVFAPNFISRKRKEEDREIFRAIKLQSNKKKKERNLDRESLTNSPFTGIECQIFPFVWSLNIQKSLQVCFWHLTNNGNVQSLNLECWSRGLGLVQTWKGFGEDRELRNTIFKNCRNFTYFKWKFESWLIKIKFWKGKNNKTISHISKALSFNVL